MFDIFRRNISRNYEQYLSDSTKVLGCTSWYGHKFEETKNGNNLFCPICGAVRKL